jgi:cbb3-type cytochrome c oxidase subunit III
VLLAAALATLLAGCGGGASSSTTAARARTTTAADAAAQARLMHDGATVFARHCATCHGLLGKPNLHSHVDAPPLNLDEVRPEPTYARTRLDVGGIGMGGWQSVLSARALRAVRAYVLAVSGRDVVVPAHPSAASMTLGAQVFAAHCERCHGLAGRPATGRLGIWPGTDLTLVKPSIAFTERLVRTGEHQAMPSFRHRLSAAQIHAVAIYTTVMAGPRAASGAPDR